MNSIIKRSAVPSYLDWAYMCRSMFAGDNFVRYTGEVTGIAERQLFAWDASGKGVDVHMQADPTKAELLHKNFEAKKEQFQESQKQSILEKVSPTGLR